MRFFRIAHFVVAVWAVLLASLAAAQQLPGAAGASAGPGAEGHGWLVIGPSDAPKLVHVPPRGSVEVGGGRLMSGGGGTVRLAARLTAMPEALAAEGRAAYLIFPPGAGGKRLVLRVSVSPAPVGNLWDIDQSERLDAMPSLDAPGKLEGFVATEFGLAALTADGSAQHLHILRRNAWTQVQLPGEIGAGEKRLVAGADGIAVLAEADGKSDLWRGRAPVAKADAPLTLTWKRTAMPAVGLGEETRPTPLFWIGSALCLARPTTDGLEISEVRLSGVRRLATLPDVASRFAMTALPQSGRIIVLWTHAKAGDGALPSLPLTSENGAYEVREVSAYTGRVLYQGAPAESWPFSLLEFRLLALLLVAIVVGVLLFVLRPEGGDGAVLLPPGMALAEPWRRALAGALDVSLAWLVVSSSLGVTLESLLFPVLGAKLVPVILMVLAAGCFHSTLGEWLFGRSFGKVVTGCRVVVVGATGDPGPGNAPPAPPPFRAALIRNLVRWGVPPLGIAALADSAGRHRGDVLARTAVVVPIADDEEGPE